MPDFFSERLGYKYSVDEFLLIESEQKNKLDDNLSLIFEKDN